MTKVEKNGPVKRQISLADIAFEQGRRIVSLDTLKRSDRRLRFEEAKRRVFAEHRELLRRLAE